MQSLFRRPRPSPAKGRGPNKYRLAIGLWPAHNTGAWLGAARKPAGIESDPIMAWIYLFLAGLCEIAWAVGLKYTHGLTRFWPSLWTILFMLLSFLLLAQATHPRHSLPIGTSYAIWTGMGAVGTALLGILLFQEPRNPLRLACIALIVIGILGLKASTPPPANP